MVLIERLTSVENVIYNLPDEGGERTRLILPTTGLYLTSGISIPSTMGQTQGWSESVILVWVYNVVVAIVYDGYTIGDFESLRRRIVLVGMHPNVCMETWRDGYEMFSYDSGGNLRVTNIPGCWG